MFSKGYDVGIIAFTVASVTHVSSYVEENHDFKLESKKAQNMQQTRPGAPSQDLMSYWGRLPTLSSLLQC